MLRTIVKSQIIIFANVSKHKNRYGGMHKTLFYTCQQCNNDYNLRLNVIHLFVSCSYYFLYFNFFSYFYADIGFFMLPTNNKVSDRRSLTKNRNGLSIFTVFWKKFAESTPISTPVAATPMVPSLVTSIKALCLISLTFILSYLVSLLNSPTLNAALTPIFFIWSITGMSDSIVNIGISTSIDCLSFLCRASSIFSIT